MKGRAILIFSFLTALLCLFCLWNFRKESYTSFQIRKDETDLSFKEVWNASLDRYKQLITKPQLQVDTLFYNHVPKTGSTSFHHLIQKLQQSHRGKGFAYIDCGILEPAKNLIHRLDTDDKINKFIDTYFSGRNHQNNTNLLVTKHMYFLDFDRIHRSDIALKYINHVRSPVDRFVSQYSVNRHDKTRKHLTGEYFDLSIHDCINHRYSECTYPNETMVIVRFFCGHDPVCLEESSAAVTLAKRNIEKHYISVGLLERLRDYIEVLEYLLPQYFSNFTKLYDSTKTKQKNITQKKQTPTENEIQVLKDSLRYDQEIYDFVQQRFANQFRTIKKQ